MTIFAFELRLNSPDAPSGDDRFEYRVWSRAAAALPTISVLQSNWKPERTEKRADIYLLGENATHALIKLRDGGRLEIKLRGRDHAGLQYWSVAMSQAFPLSPTALDQFTAHLPLPESLQPGAGLSPAHLLAALLWPGSTIETPIVRKSRLLFRRGSCRAEITHVGLSNQSWMTVAIEDAEPISAAHAVDDLRLGRLPNRSYGDFLCAPSLPDAQPSLDP